MKFEIGKNNALNSLALMCLVAGVPTIVVLWAVFSHLDDYAVVDYFAKSPAGVWLLLNIVVSFYGFILLVFFQEKVIVKESRFKYMLPFYLTAVTGIATLFLAYNDKVLEKSYGVLLIAPVLFHIFLPLDLLFEVNKKKMPKFLKFYNIRNKKILVALCFLLYSVVSCLLYYTFAELSFKYQGLWNLYENLELYLSVFGIYGVWLFFNAIVSLYLGIFLFKSNEYVFKKRLFVYVPIFILFSSGMLLFLISFTDETLSIAPSFLVFPMSLGSLSMYFLLKKHFKSLNMVDK